MPAQMTDEFESFNVSEIIVENRQRFEKGDIEKLAESIKKHGQLQPIIITRQKVLVAGERRLRAKQLLAHHFIDCVFVEDCDEVELKEIEFEENWHRKDLDWKEKCQGIVEIYSMLLLKDGKFTSERLASRLSVDPSTISRWLQVGQAIESGHDEILNASSLSAAYNILERQHARSIDQEIDSLEDVLDGVLEDVAIVEEEVMERGAPVITVREKPTTLRQASKDLAVRDFRSWVKSYSGPKFNFIHCDFPYGISHDKSKQGSSAAHGAYEDTPELYYDLLDHLVDYRDSIMSESCHIMFWLSMNYWRYTYAKFEGEMVPYIDGNGQDKFKPVFTVSPFPLIWYKSDNTGIVPDPQRGPRRVYEAAMMISRGDRKIVKPIANLHPWASRKKDAKHLSEKPPQMLRHFFQMYVDSTTTMLDPSCGSGSSLLAAQDLKALRVVGMDIDESHIERATMDLNRVRAMGGLKEEEEGADTRED